MSGTDYAWTGRHAVYKTTDTPAYSPKRIRQLLIEYDLSHGEFAGMLGITPQHLSSILTGRRNITLTLDKLMVHVFQGLEDERNRRSVGCVESA